ncbi:MULTISPECIES: pyrroline-5-carboxylate reductase [unclassified Fusibacter]|uniref:pyrroline-5-carboxylate reductase n=1 Tax=unclassified Fusibacter TaxID=2624464 RepID=UPI001012E534|nr:MULTISPECIES: pyrroline-5-carboxylate reductase [unclassified Fusibacter]MCK8059785.1 pyrroline-5-carboxylate reductase [Fusibacter sp. A2]NPE21586.1 pyrroline-5-carboxylate reductase [Fusibacter sp. A1]RXV61993.1 pyrroline-5-carboxylate reductase [Fusibacter sp. A1]
MEKKIGFIGSGNLAYALISGMISSGEFSPSAIKASNPGNKRLEKIRGDFRIRVTHDNRKVVEFADIVILTVKPKYYKTVIDEIKDLVSENQVIVTVAAGVSTDYVENCFGKKVKVIRTMPNTPALVREAMTALCTNKHATAEDMNVAQALFNCVGDTEVVNEELMDVVTAISGSSPAIVYMFIEALADGAVLKGMNRDQAYKLVSQAVLGSAKMVRDLGVHPGQLKDNVTSAGGTSIEALFSLEKSGFRGTIMEAIEKCTNKSVYLSEQLDSDMD